MYHFNNSPNYMATLSAHYQDLLGPRAVRRVREFLSLREDNSPTPLLSLPTLAEKCGVSTLHIKDEGRRLGQGSFKALGGAYAVMRLVQHAASTELGREIAAKDLKSRSVNEVARHLTFACATDGNHGRSVAQGARLLGATSVIFVHAGVSEARVAYLRELGAKVIRTPGTYDESVEEAAKAARSNSWTIVSDTSWPGYVEVPGLVMQGYTILAQEILDSLTEAPTHVFLQAGVGGFAAAVAAYFRIRLGDKRPRIIIVEPDRAACLFASMKAGCPTRARHVDPTIMAMLECYAPSIVALDVLEHVADLFMAIPDEVVAPAMRTLAFPELGDPAIISGESGVAGLAGFFRLLETEEISSRIELGRDSRVLLINTEEATDPALYETLVGRSVAEMRVLGPQYR